MSMLGIRYRAIIVHVRSAGTVAIPSLSTHCTKERALTEIDMTLRRLAEEAQRAGDLVVFRGRVQEEYELLKEDA